MSPRSTSVLPLLQLVEMDVKIESAADAGELHAFSRAAEVRNCAGICISARKST